MRNIMVVMLSVSVLMGSGAYVSDVEARPLKRMMRGLDKNMKNEKNIKRYKACIKEFSTELCESFGLNDEQMLKAQEEVFAKSKSGE